MYTDLKKLEEDHSKSLPYTAKEMEKISHSLGIRLYESVMSHQLKDKKLPNEFYRNHFSAPDNIIFEGLVEKGFARKRDVFDSNCYHITELGIEKFRLEFVQLVNYQPKENRDLTYLKKRINFFCDFYSYKFGEDNSGHIIDEYYNKFSKGIYVSHTTKNVIAAFYKELKSHFNSVKYALVTTES